jgi:AGZA family xanthine/uracil permease-like MFS transporter
MAPEGAWAAHPAVALGYLFFGLVCVLYSFLPGAKDPVVVDEADVVTGH